MQSGHRGRSHELHLTCVSRPECLQQYKASAVEVSMSATTTSPANDGRADTPPHLVWGRGSTPSDKNDGRLPSPLPLLQKAGPTPASVSYTHLRAHETKANLVCRLLLEKKKKKKKKYKICYFFLCYFFFFLMIRRPPRSTPLYSSAASDVYKRQSPLPLLQKAGPTPA